MLYKHTHAWDTSADTIRIAGVDYPVSGRDSIHYAYDALQRLVSKDLTQGFRLPGKLYPSTYLEHTLTERIGIGPQKAGIVFNHPIETTGHRLLAYTHNGYSTVSFDSLRIYSAEGILTSAVQRNYNATYPPKSKSIPNVKLIIESGNVTRIESYDESGKIDRITRYVYDNKHYAPLATETFLGETSRNVLVRKVIITYQANSRDTTDFTYTNEYDDEGRLISQLEYELPKTYNPTGNKILTNFYY